MATLPRRSPISDNFTSRYIRLRKLGEGGFGAVYIVQRKRDNQQFAGKYTVSHPKGGVSRAFIKEYTSQSYLGNTPDARGVLAVVEGIIAPTDTWLILPIASEDLYTYIGEVAPFTADQFRNYAYQLLQSLAYIHNRGYLHRDIKPQNILRFDDTDELFLADFGIAKRFTLPNQGPLETNVVTRWYRAPELLLGDTNYGPAIDVWSMACVFAEMLNKQAILPGDNEADQLNRIYFLTGTPNNYTWPEASHLPKYTSAGPVYLSTLVDQIRDWIARGAANWAASDQQACGVLLHDMFALDPHRRPSARQLLDYPFFLGQGAGLNIGYELGSFWLANDVVLVPRDVGITYERRTDMMTRLSTTTNSLIVEGKAEVAGFYRASYLLDQFLTRITRVPDDKQLLSQTLAAFFLAGKLEFDAVYAGAGDIASLWDDVDRKSITIQEREILRTAEPVEMSGPLAIDFIMHWADIQHQQLAEFLARYTIVYGYYILLQQQITSRGLAIVVQDMTNNMLDTDVALNSIYTENPLTIWLQYSITKNHDATEFSFETAQVLGFRAVFNTDQPFDSL